MGAAHSSCHRLVSAPASKMAVGTSILAWDCCSLLPRPLQSCFSSKMGQKYESHGEGVDLIVCEIVLSTVLM